MRKDLIVAAGYMQADLPAAAVDAAREILVREPDDADANFIAGTALERLGDLEAAVGHLTRATATRPDDPAIAHALGVVLYRRGYAIEALPYLRTAVEVGRNPGYSESLGACLMTLSRPQEAEPFLARAASLRSDDPQAWVNWAAALVDLNRAEEAVAAADRALNLDPGHADAHMTRAIAHLLAGEWDAAWEEYDWRWQTQVFRDTYPSPVCPRWRGEALPSGSRLWVRGEQGYGDQIQFARYVPLAAARAGCPVTVSANGSLHRLLRDLPGVAECVEILQAAEGCAAEIPMQSLPLVFATRPDLMPAAAPFLAPPVASPGLPPAAPGRLRIGVVWAGKPKPRHRAVDPHRLAEAFAGLPLDVYSFQVGPPRAEMPGGWTDLADRLTDFAETAALLAQMDAVVSVDTATAHLAGAIGVPLYLLLIRGADWRWLRERETTPWYPGARLLRQRAVGDWSSPLADLRDLLINSTCSSAATSAESR